MLRQANQTLPIRANRSGLHEITSEVTDWVASIAIENGLLTLFCRHTSASLLIQENAAPAARRDLGTYFARIAPEGANYEHDEEGPDDMPAHLRAALTQTQLTIPFKTAVSRSGRGRASTSSNIVAMPPSARSRRI